MPYCQVSAIGLHIAARDGVARGRVALILAFAAVMAGAHIVGQARPAEIDPFSFFEPVVTISASDRQRIDNGEVFVRILPARDGEVAVFAASRFDAQPEALVRWTQAIESLKRSPFVVAIRRFSSPPVLSDLDALALDDVDLEGIRRCQAGDCSVKLARTRSSRSGKRREAAQSGRRRFNASSGVSCSVV